MKVATGDSSTWAKREKKRMRERTLRRILLFLPAGLLALSLALISDYRVDSGGIYPRGFLADEKEGEPVCRAAEGYGNVVQVPDMPYIMCIKGKEAGETQGTRLFLDGDIYIAVSGREDGGSLAGIYDGICRELLSETPLGLRIFVNEQGYLNNRNLIYLAATEETASGKDYYTMNYSVDLPEGGFVLGCFSRDSDAAGMKEELDKAFFSLRRVGGSQNAEPDAGTGPDGKGITETGEEDGAPMDGETAVYSGEYAPEGGSYGEGGHYVHDKPEEQLKAYQEKVLAFSEEDAAGKRYVLFNYSLSDVVLDYIYLYAPDGTLMTPFVRHEGESGDYVFAVGAPQSGDYRLRFSAGEKIGYFYTYVMTEEEYGLYEQGRDNPGQAADVLISGEE